MPKDGVKLTPESDLLTTQELLTVIKTFAKLGVDKIRLTGGEPTLRKDLIPLCKEISSIPGIKQLTMTTNGLLLTRMGRGLQENGVTALNISLDTLHKEKFEAITQRSGLSLVMNGLAHCLTDLQFSKIKLNCVVKRGLNEHELVNFVQMTQRSPIQVRFLEHMPFDSNGWTDHSVVPYEEMVHIIKQMYPGFRPMPSSNNEVAKLWQVPGFAGEIGFITAMSDKFCSSCNRLRLTSDGNIKACLFGEEELSIRSLVKRGALEDDLIEVIQRAIWNKKEKLGGHATPRDIALGTNRPMILIGG